MVYNSETFVALHELTEKGKEIYQKILEEEADRILFKHQHPFKYLIQKIKSKFDGE